jgi:purine nucleoside permease
MLPHLLLGAVGLVSLVAAAPAELDRRDNGPIAPKVFLVTHFTPETDIWLEPFGLTAHNITVPGLSPLYPQVGCNENYEICIYTTGESLVSTSALDHG